MLLPFDVRTQCWLLGFVLALLLATLALAQTQFGTITGRVVDPAGAVLIDVKVGLKSASTGVAQETKTNSEGLYVIANVPAGDYELTIQKDGFRKSVRRLTVEVAQRVTADFNLEVGAVTESVEVLASTVVVNTVSGEMSRQITTAELQNMPLLTRNPYALVSLSAGASDTGQVTGDTRGLGISIGGARTSSVNFMLDGGENNDTFTAGVGQTVPLDAVQEFKVQTSSTTAEFGRNAAVTNVVTKSGSNSLHGSAYEYYRGAGLTTATYEDNANNTPKANFVRNQFGFSFGGPIKKDKTFFFGSMEGIRVRGTSTARYFVPTDSFYNASSTYTQNFLDAFGGVPASNCNDVAIPASYFGALNDSNGNPINPATNLFCRTTLKRPSDNGGGTPQNTWMWTARIDHHLSDATSLLFRYAFQNNNFFEGSNSFSPYQGFNTGTNQRVQNMNVTATHTFSPTLFSELRLTYERFYQLQPLGKAPATTPCWYYRSAFSSPTGDEITFPGYVPDVCSFAGIPFGGPQNVYQLGNGWTKSKGKHTFKWGGQLLHMRDNRMFGAYENAFERTNSMQGMIDGFVDRIQVAYDPRGKVPGDTYDVNVDGPFAFPRFDRHFHYNEFAMYGEDSFKITPRFTLTAGLRWEYFGVLHSPEKERYLDANLFLNAVGAPTGQTIFEQIRDARFQRTNNLYNQDFFDLGPRIGLAYDPLGNGRTVFRAGYGLYYDRNFGNAVFNVIQNPPNYAVATLSLPGLAPIFPNQFDSLTASGGTQVPVRSSARMLDRKMKTAYSAQWNATIEHDITGKGLIGSISYLGANGYHLYSLNNLNEVGSCVVAPSINSVCVADPNNSNSPVQSDTRLNQTGLTGMNRRGNEGLSRYNALAAEIKMRQLAHTGLTLIGNYTWAHSIDNESSFFADSPFEGNFGFGFRDPYNPKLDRTNSTNDIRHRVTISGSWDLPFAKDTHGITGQVLGGWTLSSIFAAQTGGAFSVYDQSGATACWGYDETNFCYPVQVGNISKRTATPTGDPNSFAVYNLSSVMTNVENYCNFDYVCATNMQFLTPQLLSARNLFRTPGFYNMDFAILKSFKLPKEGMRLQFRAEAFNLLNHSNLYVVPGANAVVCANPDDPTCADVLPIVGKKGVPPGSGVAKERRNIQLALRLTF